MIIFFLLSLYLPVEDWYYSYLDELRVRGEIPIIFIQNAPLNQERVLNNLKNIENKTEDSQNKLICRKLINFLDYGGFYLKSNQKYDTTFRSFQNARVKAKVMNFSCVLEITSKVGKSDEYPPLSWDTIIGIDYRRGYGSYMNGGFEIMLGREPLRFGPYPGPSLLISGRSPPFNHIWLSYEHKKFKGTYFFTALDPYTADTSKFLAFHRIEVALFNNKFLFSFSEAVIFCRRDLFSGMAYLNPFGIYRLSEYNYHYGNDDLNLITFNDDLYWDFDFAWYIKKNKSIYGELLLDDLNFNIQNPKYPGFIEDIVESGPFGFIVGLKLADFPLRKFFSLLQYTRVNANTYFHFEPCNYYIYMGFPIGHPEGPDFDEILYSLIYHLQPSWDLLLSLNHIRHGKTRLAYDAEVPQRNCFLWGKEEGRVEQRTGTLIGTTFFLPPKLTIRLNSGYVWVNNYQNQHGVKKNFTTIDFQIGFNL